MREKVTMSRCPITTTMTQYIRAWMSFLAAELGSICRLGRNCVLCQDNGLTLAHTIAHEIAHTLNITHDDDQTECGSLIEENEEKRVMAAIMESDVGKLTWSKCSQKQIR